MCVLKHSKLLRLPVRKECFNTTNFFIYKKISHPRRRPFVLVYSVAQDLVSCQHFKKIYVKSWFLTRLRFSDSIRARSNLSRISWFSWSSVRVCSVVNLTSRILRFKSDFFIFSLLKTKNPRVFNPRVLEVCYVNFCLHYGLPDPWNLWCAIIWHAIDCKPNGGHKARLLGWTIWYRM